MFDLVIGVTIANHIHIARQIKSFQLFYFSIISRKWIISIEAGDITLLIKMETVGQNVFRLHAIFGNDGINEGMKTIRDDIDVICV